MLEEIKQTLAIVRERDIITDEKSVYLLYIKNKTGKNNVCYFWVRPENLYNLAGVNPT